MQFLIILSEKCPFVKWRSPCFCIANVGALQNLAAAAKSHTLVGEALSPPEVYATEYPIEWYLPTSFEFLASPGGELDFLTSGTSEPIGKKD